MRDRILSALEGEHHGIKKEEVYDRVKPETPEDRDEFFEAWQKLTDQGRIVRTSRGFKAGAGGFGRGGWGR